MQPPLIYLGQQNGQGEIKKINHSVIAERKNGGLNMIDFTSMNKVHLDKTISSDREHSMDGYSQTKPHYT